MNKKVQIGARGGTVTLTDKYYKAAGGEASIYVNGGKAFKIYHDEKKALAEKKMRELAGILNGQVIIPQDIIFDAATGKPIGYTTQYIDDAEPLVKFFTKTFKQDNNIDPKMTAELVKQMQLVTMDVHKANCLIVDYNEMNVLVTVTPTLLTPYYIDTDSYATPSFKATAIMESIRDRKASKTVNGHLVYDPTIESDWFSWGVLTFWLYTNIHPFRGNHKNYAPRDKAKMMDDGISIFHKDVRVPPSVTPFNTIPKRHLDWFKDVFLDGNRSIPPLADSTVPVTVPTQIVVVTGNNNIDVTQVAAYADDVVSLFQFSGMNHVVTHKKIYIDQKEMWDGCDKVKKTLLCPASDGTIILATQMGTKVTFTELVRQKVVDTISSPDSFARNGCIYTVTNGKLVENRFTAFGDKIIHRLNEVENVSIYSATVYEGCVIQDLLGKKHLTIPYKQGACFSKYLPQLDKHRVVSAKSERNVTVIIAEHAGKYDRFVIVFRKDFSEFDVRKVEDVAYDTINFTVMENGLCVLLANPDELELFGNNQKVEVLNDPPFDSTMKLFNTSEGIFFINGNTIHKIKRK